MERIFALRPDLVILYGSQQDQIQQLTRAGIPVFSYAHGGLADTLSVIRQLGTRTGHTTEAQRVAMARAFANAPKLILADEPTSSLDPANRDLVLNLLFSLCAQTGATVVVVSHSPIVAQRPEFTQRLNL
jgi:ABC-type cobalamin/Fe3+-siderophores transport system ATPase subunit